MDSLMRAYIFGIVLFASLHTFGQDPAPSSEATAKTVRNSYSPPTAEELAPLRSEYLAELAKIHEPPEFALKPMSVRKPVSSTIEKLFNAMPSASPERASHEQRAKEIQELLKIVGEIDPSDTSDRSMAYG